MAYFSQAGTLARIHLLSPQDIKSIHELRVSPSAILPAQLYLEDMLYVDCGGR